jgi:hypothetical protein
MQPDGNLVMYDSQGHAKWANNTQDPGVPLAPVLVIQDDGNAVIYYNGPCLGVSSGAGSLSAPVWSTGTQARRVF